jgi:hypothetical protein
MPVFYYWTQLYATFNYRSAQSGNFIVTVGNAEVSNKMVSYKPDQNFYSSGGSCVALEKQYSLQFSVHVVASRGNIGLLNTFQEAGNVYVINS